MEYIKGKKVKLLFVCLGNICRSPAAEGVMRALVERAGLCGEIEIDSAGLNGYHDGERADRRMRIAASARGYNLTSISRRVRPEVDFSYFDMIIGMDSSNISALKRLSSEDMHKKIHIMTEFCQLRSESVVPDPYFGGEEGFNHVLDILEDSCAGLLKRIIS